MGHQSVQSEVAFLGSGRGAKHADFFNAYFKSACLVSVKEKRFHLNQVEDIEKIEQKERVLKRDGACVERKKIRDIELILLLNRYLNTEVI